MSVNVDWPCCAWLASLFRVLTAFGTVNDSLVNRLRRFSKKKGTGKKFKTIFKEVGGLDIQQ